MPELGVHRSAILTDLALCINRWRLLSPGWYVVVLAKVQLSPEEWEVPGLVALVNYGRKKQCAVRDEVFHGPPTIPNSSAAASGSRGMVLPKTRWPCLANPSSCCGAGWRAGATTSFKLTTAFSQPGLAQPVDPPAGSARPRLVGRARLHRTGRPRRTDPTFRLRRLRRW